MATQLFANNVNTTVSSTFSNVATTLNVVDGSKMPSPTGGNWFLLTLFTLNANGQENAWEIVKVTARATNALTVVRAQEGTTALSWAVTAGVSLRATAATLAAKADKVGDSLTTPAIGVATGISLNLTTSFTMGSSGAGGRIYGDFSSTSHNLRSLIQSLVINGNTILGLIPNGSAVIAGINLYNSQDPLNAGLFQVNINNAAATINSYKMGAGATLPLQLAVDNVICQTLYGDGASLITDAMFLKFKETTHEVANVSNVFTIDLANGSIQRASLTANSTIILPSPIAGKSYTIWVNYTGAYSVTWQVTTGDLRWPDGNVAPTATMVSGKVDKYVFVCFGTSSIYGADAGRNS